ncbi:mechanosensitive ion channel [Pseudomonas sp. gcc21]|nr:mechanosensitive ion channel [Pseudomonas sp. gcc21]
MLGPVTGWAATTADAEITAPEARRALQTLQDETQREEVVRTLETIAAGADAGDEPAGEENGEGAAAEESPIAQIVPLEEGGLIARTLEQVGQWADSLAEQLARLGNALTELPAWFEATFVSEVGRALLAQVLTDLAIVFGIGLGLEWLLRRVLRKGAQTLIDSADEADQRPAIPRRPAAPISSEDLAEQAVAGLRPIQDGTALVHVQRDGVEQVESVTVGVVKSGSDPVIEPGTGEQVSGTYVPVNKASKAEPELTALRHLPFAFASFVLDLLPLGLFFGIAALTLHFLPGLDSRTHEVTSEFVMAYVITRITMAVVRLLASPTRYSLRIARISDNASQLLHRWARGLVVLATFGVAIANAVEILGTGPSARLLIIKSVSLLAHIAVVILVFRIRHRVGALIAGPQERSGTWAVLRRWLARIWPYLASALVLGSWLIRTMHIEDGFPRLIEFVGVSGAIIVLGRLVAVLALGALGRLVDEDEESEQANGLRHRLAEDYYPLLRALVIFIIAAATLLALLQAWGLDALAWFAPGTIGGSLASAALTILVAVILAIIVWQTTNAAIDRRIKRWREQGDTVRAARLRTLLPMLRSGLMIIIVLVVGFTALSQIGINTTPLLAGASIIGVAVGFGSQKLVQDFITGIFLLMENTMQVGDWVTVAGVSGTVENLSIRTVRLRAGDGSLHIVPFSSVSTVNNTTRGLGNAAVRISVRYDTNINQAISELKAIGAGLRADPAFEQLIIADLEVWGVDAVDGSMFTLAGQMRCVDKGRWGVQREMNRRILERFRELGIHVADPRERLVGSIKTR